MGFFGYDGKSFAAFTTKDGQANLGGWSILGDTSGNLWVGTKEKGLYIFDGKEFISYSDSINNHQRTNKQNLPKQKKMNKRNEPLTWACAIGTCDNKCSAVYRYSAVVRATVTIPSFFLT
jgi:hypothetical protein